MKTSGYKEKEKSFLGHFWVLLIVFYGASTFTGSLGYEIGSVYPSNAEIAIGSDINITCQMNTTAFNDTSSCLNFRERESNSLVPKENIHIINESSIVYIIRNAAEQSSSYTCKCNESGVDIANIYVGTPPTKVTDFRCRGYGFSYMTCKFTAPKNSIFTDYKLKLKNTSLVVHEYELQYSDKPFEWICNITMDNGYHIDYPNYTFELTSYNSLGISTQSIVVDHYARIVPEKPAVEIGNITAHGVTFSWIVTKFRHYNSTYGLLYEIRLRPFKLDWIDIDTKLKIRSNDEYFSTDINNLKYAFWRYDVIVRVKTVRASNDITMWSEPFVGSFITIPEPPENPPVVDVGGFYIDPMERNIRLYWQDIPEWEKNGPDFQYIITDIRQDGNIVHIFPTSITDTSVSFNWNSTSDYEFKIKSQNQVGQSFNSSVLRVPKSRSRSAERERIRTMTKLYPNQTYTVSWSPPFSIRNVVNFTVFWCIPKIESQSECKETINSKHLHKDTTNYTTQPQNHVLNFAVAANYANDSTGMIWSRFTADATADLPKIDLVATAISSDSIKIKWDIPSVYFLILKGYNLNYCKVKDNVWEKYRNCINGQTTLNIWNQTEEYIITGLESFQTYKITIFMFSEYKVGPLSYPAFETTSEEAPTPPRNLKYENVTSNSITISWLPPQKSNGNLRYYTIWENTERHKVYITKSDNVNKITFKLENLSSYSNYEIYITAHTVKSSQPSNGIHIRTLITSPSVTHLLTMQKSEDSLMLSWDAPIVPSGRVEFYEVRISKYNETGQSKVARVASNDCRISLPKCSGPNYIYKLTVRAVNVAQKSEIDYKKLLQDENRNEINEEFFCIGSKPVPQHYFDDKYILLASGWGNGQIYTCSETLLNKLTVFALIVITIVLSTLFAVYYARRKYYEMSNINIILPESMYETKTPVEGVCIDKLFDEKESHNLLLTEIGNDSGIAKCARIHHQKDNKKKLQGADSFELNDKAICSCTSTLIEKPNRNSMEAITNDDKLSICKTQPTSVVISNRYVHPRTVKKDSEYKIVDAMKKPILQYIANDDPLIDGSSHVIDSKGDSTKTHPVNGDIFGYVTCKQLFEFGQNVNY